MDNVRRRIGATRTRPTRVGTDQGDQRRAEEEGGGVGDDQAGEAGHLDHDAAEGAADQAGQVAVEADEGVGADQVGLGDQGRDQGVAGGVVELGQGGLHGHDQVDDPEPVPAVHGQQWEQERGLGQADRDQGAAAVPAVDQDAGQGAHDQAGEQADEEHRRGDEAGAGDLEDPDREADEQEPVARLGDEAAGPEQAEVAPAQQGPAGLHVRASGRRNALKSRWTGWEPSGGSSRVSPMYGRMAASRVWTRSASSSAVRRSE